MTDKDPFDKFIAKPINEIISSEEDEKLKALGKEADEKQEIVSELDKERNKLLKIIPFKLSEEKLKLQREKRSILDALNEQRRKVIAEYKTKEQKLNLLRKKQIEENSLLKENMGKRIKAKEEYNESWERFHKRMEELRKKYEEKEVKK